MQGLYDVSRTTKLMRKIKEYKHKQPYFIFVDRIKMSVLLNLTYTTLNQNVIVLFGDTNWF